MSIRLALMTLMCFGTLNLACGASLDALRSQVAFDTSCAEASQQIVSIEAGKAEVRACGRTVYYKQRCPAGVNPEEDDSKCKWVKVDAP